VPVRKGVQLEIRKGRCDLEYAFRYLPKAPLGKQGTQLARSTEEEPAAFIENLGRWIKSCRFVPEMTEKLHAFLIVPHGCGNCSLLLRLLADGRDGACGVAARRLPRQTILSGPAGLLLPA